MVTHPLEHMLEQKDAIPRVLVLYLYHAPHALQILKFVVRDTKSKLREVEVKMAPGLYIVQGIVPSGPQNKQEALHRLAAPDNYY
jgi:hypothetical protein